MSLGKITSWEPCRCSVAQGKPLSCFTGLCWAWSLYRATKWQKKDLWICLSPRADEMNKAAKLSWGLLSFRVSPSCPSPAYLTPSILPSAPSVFPLQYGTFPWSLLWPQLDKLKARMGTGTASIGATNVRNVFAMTASCCHQRDKPQLSVPGWWRSYSAGNRKWLLSLLEVNHPR